ncbi:MAG: YbaB/EbfC family nucleoid-associated protein [Bacilli bacterium]|nr:YbaB/EbfC family nucleoid-associated protein [Bacilli bacterium]
MNLQAMMKQAQKMQKEMMNSKNEIDEMTFTGTSSFVTVEMKGTKEVTKVKIDTENIEKDEIEMLEDMILVAVNEAIKKVDAETEKKLGKYTQGMPGLF